MKSDEKGTTMTDRIDFTGRVAVVTGGGGGLGRAYCLGLAARGAKVVVNDLGGAVDGAGGDATPAQRVAEEIRSAGGEAVADATDITDRAAVTAMIDATVDRWGSVDLLVNNAGVLRDRSFAKMDPADFDMVVGVHLTGTVNCTRAAWPHMIAAGYGRVLLTTSTSGIYGNFGQSNYGAAKSGLVGLMNVLAIEGAAKGVRVNAIAPTAATRMTEGLLSPEAADALTPESIVPGALFLLSEQAPTKTILGAGAGTFAVSRMVESPGVYLPELARTPEIVAERWAEISDPTGEAPLETAGDQTRKYLRRVTGDRG
ncbi:SDR family NAD(P)-dependent oxidoreductase [Dietzia aurantiaca]|uniref:SDR family NAD(P)-dependent oxidoreductase n=1 Tax=Dietzia aurantiaca TaxID=983873 RepID=A0ABV9PQV4_9ACTN